MKTFLAFNNLRRQTSSFIQKDPESNRFITNILYHNMNGNKFSSSFFVLSQLPSYDIKKHILLLLMLLKQATPFYNKKQVVVGYLIGVNAIMWMYHIHPTPCSVQKYHSNDLRFWFNTKPLEKHKDDNFLTEIRVSREY